MTKPHFSIKNTLITASGTICSRILGVLKWSVVSYLYGAKLDLFHASFTHINNIRKIIGEGALTNAFIPVLSLQEKEDQQSFLDNITSIFLIASVILVIILCMGTPFVLPYLMPGYESKPLLMQTVIKLTIFMFPACIFFMLFALGMGVLNVNSKFFASSYGPTLFNVFFILVPLILYKPLGIFALALGVLLGSFSMFFIEFLEMRKIGFTYHFHIDLKDPKLKEFFKIFRPTVFNMFIQMLLPVAFVFFVSFYPKGAFTALRNTNIIAQLPVGVIGITLASVLFPVLSAHYATKASNEVKILFRNVFYLFFYLMIPIMGFFFLFPEMIINVLFVDFPMLFTHSTGEMTKELLQMSYYCLRMYAFASLFWSLMIIFTKIFYANHKVRVPLYLNLFLLAVTTLSYAFVCFYNQEQVVWIAFSDCIGAGATTLLGAFLILKQYKFLRKNIFYTFLKFLIVDFLLLLLFYFIYQKIYFRLDITILKITFSAFFFFAYSLIYVGLGILCRLKIPNLLTKKWSKNDQAL